MIIYCPKCNEELELSDDTFGRKLQCCYCNVKFIIDEKRGDGCDESKKVLRVVSPSGENQEEVLPSPIFETLRENDDGSFTTVLQLLGENVRDASGKPILKLRNVFGGNEIKQMQRFAKYQEKVLQGDVQSQYRVGLYHYTCYERFIGSRGKNLEEALKWLKMAASQGHEGAKNICLIHANESALKEALINVVGEKAANAFLTKKSATSSAQVESQGSERSPERNVSGATVGPKSTLQTQVENKSLPVIRIKLPAKKRVQAHELSDEEKLKLRGERGEAKAQYELAVKLMNGQGVVRNETEGLKWLRKAADQGELNALHNMGIAYFNGLGVDVDKAEGVRWYRLAAERGNENAQYDFAICLANGFGVEKDMDQAFFWFKKAAEHGRADAMYNVGICYGNGYGVKKDVDEAMKWFQKAADAGDEAAKKIVEPKVYTGDDAIKMIQKICQESDAKRETKEPLRSAASPVTARPKNERSVTMKRNTTTTTPQHLGKGSGVDWSRENKTFAEMLAKYGIRKFHVEMVNPYCAEVSMPMTEGEDVVRDFANDLFHALDILDEGCDLEFGQLTDCSGIDINEDAKCYYVLFNQHDVAECNPGDGKYKYKIEAITANGADDEDDDSDETADGELTPAQIMKYIADGIKSGAIRSKSGEGYFVLKGEFYDAIEAGRKTTEYRDLTPRNLSLSIGIKTVKFQRGYGHPGQPPKQMRFEVSSVRLMDADDRECDPYAIPPGFIATTIAINLGRRIG